MAGVYAVLDSAYCDMMSTSKNRIVGLVLLLTVAACTAAHTTPPMTSLSTRSSIDEPMVISTVPGGATVVGRVVEGYGRHRPISSLPLWPGKESSGEPLTTTDANGQFELTNLPVGQTIYVNGSHLTFQMMITSHQTVDLGILKYPLIHPYNYYYWTPYPLQYLAQLVLEGESLPFSVCKQDDTWQRPIEEEQRQQVWCKRPFQNLGQTSLQSWFQRPVALYDTIDMFGQSFPDGPRLDDLGAEQVYLLGLWTAAPGPLESSKCPYTPEALEALLDRSQVEVWLLGYQATEVQALSTENADIDEDALCDSRVRNCTMRPGYHYAVHVQPAQGYQVIRFKGYQGAIAIHVMVEGEEIAQIP